MGVRKISAFFMASLLVLSSLTLFSFADGGEVFIKDSGSPEVSLMALRSIASDDGISLAAAEGNSGQFGYDIRPFEGDLNFSDYGYGSSTTRNYYSYFLNLPVGQYQISFQLSENFSNAGALYSSGGSGSVLVSKTVNDNSATLLVNVPSAGRFEVWGYNSSGFSSSVSSLDFKISTLKPVEGISCGWSVNQAFSETNRRDAFEDFTWNFGDQPAGNYILNIYHYGIAYTCDWHIAYGSSPIGENSRFIPVSNSNGVSTAIISHGGGNLILSGEVIFAHPYGDGFFDGSGNYSEYSGSGSFSIDIFQRDNWSYAVSDVIIVPLASAGLEQFGVFGSLVGFLRDGFASIKSNVVSQFSQLKTALSTEFTNLKTTITTQFTQLKTALTTEFTNLKTTITTQFTQLKTHITSQFTSLKNLLTDLFESEEAKGDVDNAKSELEQEVQELNDLSGQFNSQAGTLEQQFANDFSVPSDISGQSGNVQLVFSSLFGSFGVFTILFWLPPVLAVIKHLLRL